MSENEGYLEINRESWNRRTEKHVDSDFYKNDAFISGASSLNDIELGYLTNLEGKSILHLQCHFGQDTISMSRLGANITGVDLSNIAIERATELALKTKQSAKFICSDVYDLPNHLDDKFDIVFTSYGTIGWLPDMDKWAKVVSHFLKPGGKLVFVEFHPVVWMFDDDFSRVGYNYFNSEAIIEELDGTCATKESNEKFDSITWNHPISEVVNALLSNGLKIEILDEFDYSPYNCFRHTDEFEAGKYRIEHIGNKIPMVYSIVARKDR